MRDLLEDNDKWEFCGWEFYGSEIESPLGIKVVQYLYTGEEYQCRGVPYNFLLEIFFSPEEETTKMLVRIQKEIPHYRDIQAIKNMELVFREICDSLNFVPNEEELNNLTLNKILISQEKKKDGITFGKKVKSLRLGLGLGLKEAADKLGTSQVSLCRIEGDTFRCPKHTFKKLMELFKIPKEELEDYLCERYAVIVRLDLEEWYNIPVSYGLKKLERAVRRDSWKFNDICPPVKRAREFPEEKEEVLERKSVTFREIMRKIGN